MMDNPTLVIAVVVLAILALGAGAFAFAGGGGQGVDRKTTKRMAAVAARSQTKSRSPAAVADPAERRRKQVADTLKELERKAKQQKARLTLRQLLEQAGLVPNVTRFWSISAVVGLVVGAGVFLKMGSLQQPSLMPIAIALGAAIGAGLGLPRWVVIFLKNGRQKKFLNEFANSIDVIVRGVKSGLPLNDCLRMIGQEAADPVGGEFRTLVESMRVGVTMEDALKRFHDRMPLPEVNFFQIVLAIQQKAGGNLSEALSNLSGVLRDRKRLQGKIKALSSEAKSSAAIIGALPPLVMLLVYLSTPDYIMTLFHERTGNIMLVGCVFWMTCGILVMKKMINLKI